MSPKTRRYIPAPSIGCGDAGCRTVPGIRSVGNMDCRCYRPSGSRRRDRRHRLRRATRLSRGRDRAHRTQGRVLAEAILRVRPGATVVFRTSGLLRRRGRRNSASGWEFASGACFRFPVDTRNIGGRSVAGDGSRMSAHYSYQSGHAGPHTRAWPRVESMDHLEGRSEDTWIMFPILSVTTSMASVFSTIAPSECKLRCRASYVCRTRSPSRSLPVRLASRATTVSNGAQTVKKWIGVASGKRPQNHSIESRVSKM